MNPFNSFDGKQLRIRQRKGVSELKQDPFGSHDIAGVRIQVRLDPLMCDITHVDPADQSVGIHKNGHRFGVPRR